MTPDLQVFEILLQNQDGPLPVAAVRAHALNGLFHTEIGKKHPEVVESLHEVKNGEREPPLPFSLAPLVSDGNFLGFRVGTLKAEWGDRVADVWGGLAAKGAMVRLGSARMQVRRVKPGKPGPKTYNQLMDNSRPAHGVELSFETPTRLINHGHDTPLPVPSAVWLSYKQRWEAYSGKELPPNFVRWVEFQVHAVEANLEMYYTFIEKQEKWFGMMGDVVYQAFSDTDQVPESRLPEYLHAWQYLAQLAEYCGTGDKVTMGMGENLQAGIIWH